MIRRHSLRLQNQWLAFQSFDHDFNPPIIKQVAASDASTDSRDLNGGADEFADILKRLIALILEKQHRLLILGADFHGIDLRVDMPIDDKNVGPPVVLPIHKRLTPTHERSSGSSNAQGIRDVSKVHLAI